MPQDFLDLSKSSKIAFESLGKVSYQRKLSEVNNLKFRRSLYYVKNLKIGHRISSSDIRSVRPGFGLSPKYFDLVIGKVLKRDVNKNSPVNWNDID
jgi:N-acetylneuraminate synthase